MKTFERSFLQQEPLPEEAIAAVAEVMRSGRLHRYDATPEDPGHTALLEKEFAAYQGGKYCLACASCGYALYLAMLSAGVKSDDLVLCNAYTLAPVPGAIHNTGAKPLLVEITENLTIDVDDLAAKAPGASFLMLSHMRGHIADMDRIIEICEQNKLTLIEDCAHTLGAWWGEKQSGNFGEVSCFSTQSYKHLNSGEGGLLVTDNPQVIARAILLSGSYMLYDRHLTAPDEEVFSDLKLTTPNYSSRMDNMRAAALRPQLPHLDTNCARWNERYDVVAAGLQAIPQVRLPSRPRQERYVGSSIQFFLPGFGQERVLRVVDTCADRGVQLKFFG
jgi:dTDP-4-amino-4,6-dideoxygalactose transaminase